MKAKEALDFCLNKLQFKSVLDIGCGAGEHYRAFQKAGKNVTAVDIQRNGFNFVGDYLTTRFTSVDLIWASHLLEHQLNVNLFLRKCYSETNPGGYICVTVPPKKDEIVGGHVTIWNAGLLMYNLILAGFDCSNAHIKRYDYNISVIAKKGEFTLPELKYDTGDIETLSQWFPKGYNKHGFNGDIQELNWT